MESDDLDKLAHISSQILLWTFHISITISCQWNSIYCLSSLPMIYNKINPFPNKPWFLRVCSISLLKTLWEKEKLLVTSNFSFSHSVFYPFWTTFFHFHQIQNCRLQTLSVWKSLKFVVWERVKTLPIGKVFNFDENGGKFSKKVEKTGGGEKKEFFLFPIVFSEDLYCRQVKTRALFGLTNWN